MDLSLYLKIDEALHGMDAAFHSLVSAGLACDEEDEMPQPSETVGAPVFAREMGSHAQRALDAIHSLKQTSIHADWKTLHENKDVMRHRLELEMTKMATTLNEVHSEVRGLIQQTEAMCEAKLDRSDRI